jgi:uncharacterized membrane protein required for colicin V production
MLSLTFTFWMFVFLFAVIGAMRGWAKELLVTSAVILALFIIAVLERFLPFIQNIMLGQAGFWFRFAVLVALVFFGYQTPNLPALASSGRFARERIQDMLLGLFLGAINGYLIVGSIWWFLDQASYPFMAIAAPQANTPAGEAALKLIPFLAPAWLGAPAIYFAVAVAFVFILVVFL